MRAEHTGDERFSLNDFDTDSHRRPAGALLGAVFPDEIQTGKEAAMDSAFGLYLPVYSENHADPGESGSQHGGNPDGRSSNDQCMISHVISA